MIATHQPNKTQAANRYFAAARRAGCPRDQIVRLMRAGVVLQPRQLTASAAARQCDAPGGPTQIGYGGARGGGKSHWLLTQVAVDDCQRYAGLKCIILRKIGKSLREGFEDLLRRVLFGLPYEYVPSQRMLVFPNGSRILLGHFKDEKDIDAYLGLEYDVVGIEEATTLSASKIIAIRTCLRTSKTDWRPRLYSTANPGGVGHGWYKSLFIEPFQRRCETDTRFIPATVDDNRFLNREYISTLDALTGWQRRAWRFGDWDIAAGQFFHTWRRETHVIPWFQAPANWRVWASLDYGFTHYTVVYVLAEGDGTVYILDEYAARKTLVAQHADAIRAMLARNGVSLERLSTFVAGADVFAAKHTGETIADEYRRNGIVLAPADNDRISGAAAILRRLGDAGSGIPPTLRVTERCSGLIETLPLLQHDPHRPEDVLKIDTDDDGVGGDDWYDAARYGVMAAAQRTATSQQIGGLWRRST